MITIRSNIASLKAQRGQRVAAEETTAASERLSSGLRINKASDDAAGLSVSAGLNYDSTVQSQGVRNVNDGISLYNIADGALSTMKSTVTRMRELAAQSANGAVSFTQQRALDREFQQLAKEYNRVIDTTSFNGVSLFSTANNAISFEAGGSGISLSLGYDAYSGDGTFGATNARTSFAGATGRDLLFADLNGDGKQDAIISTSAANGLLLALGNGNGTFRAGVSYSTGAAPDVAVGDINSDGILDLVASGTTNNAFIGNGDGTFREPLAISNTNVGNVNLADMNGDGNADLVLSSYTAASLFIYNGNGDGTFSARRTVGAASQAERSRVADFNGDGKIDVAIGEINVAGAIYIYLGNGDGTVGAQTRITSGVNPNELVAADVNSDGAADLVSNCQGAYTTFIGNGDGTFVAARTVALTTGSSNSFTVADLNGDGKLDIFGRDGNAALVFGGNGDGTYSAGVTIFSNGFNSILSTSDLDGDGVQDFGTVGGGSGSLSIGIGNGSTKKTSISATKLNILGLSDLSVKSLYDARQAMTKIASAFDTLQNATSVIGASHARLSSAASNLKSSLLGIANSYSRITDVDVAAESAVLIRAQIIQKASTAILAQANQSPALALRLLGR